MNITMTDNEQYQLKCEELKKIREYQRIKAKRNYHKRKEAGTLKKYYTKKENNLKELPSTEEIDNLKCLKKREKKKTEKVEIENSEYIMLKKALAELNEYKKQQN
jgi:hypothetical protein